MSTIPKNRLPKSRPAEVQDAADAADLLQFGYRQRFKRSLSPFTSFGLGFSFISITTGIFTTFGFVLNNSGPRGIWTWPIVIIGQTLVAMCYGALAARVPAAGYSYQWGSRLANPSVGWWLGWLAFSFLAIVVVSVDYALVQVAWQPLIGQEYTPTSAAFWTLLVLGIQATLIIWSTPIVSRINNLAVTVELIGIVELVLILFSVGLIAYHASPGERLFSTGIIPRAGWYGWLGPFMLATLLGAYTIVGFESSHAMAEETPEPRRVVPRAMVRAVVFSGCLGMLLLIGLALSISDQEATAAEAAPAAFILRSLLGPQIEKLFLVFICLSIFACGMVVMVTGSRITWAMARDRRLPGHQLLSRTPRVTGGPTCATLLIAGLAAGVVLVLRTNTDALVALFSSATLMPAIGYTATVVLFAAVRHRTRQPAEFRLGRWEGLVIFGALAWLAYELIILLGPADFRAAQLYAGAALVVGVAVFALMWLLEPAAMRQDPLSAGHPEQPDVEPPPVEAHARRHRPERPAAEPPPAGRYPGAYGLEQPAAEPPPGERSPGA
jgi:amino acid transporter